MWLGLGSCRIIWFELCASWLIISVSLLGYFFGVVWLLVQRDLLNARYAGFECRCFKFGFCLVGDYEMMGGRLFSCELSTELNVVK